MWLNLAASQTDEERENAVIGRDRVADRMTPDQLAKVHRLAREWDVGQTYFAGDEVLAVVRRTLLQ